MGIREPLKELGCGLPHALEVMGERWSFLILRAAFNGLYHFEEFSQELGIARNILSNRLANLVSHGVLERTPCEADRRKIEYRLTEKGLGLLPAMLALRIWAVTYVLWIARALAALPKLLDMTAPWLGSGARALFHKGRGYAAEIEESHAKWTFDLIKHESRVDAESVILDITNLRPNPS